jgi:phage shock protein A
MKEHAKKLDSLRADFVWILAMYQEQLRTNKDLNNQVINVSATHDLLRIEYNRAYEKIGKLESMLLDEYENTSDTPCCQELVQTHERIKQLEANVRELETEKQTMLREHKTTMAEVTKAYKDLLSNAGSLFDASVKKLKERV